MSETDAPSRIIVRPEHSAWHGPLIASFYALAIVWGVYQANPVTPSPMLGLFPLTFKLMLCMWAITDANVRGKPIPILARAWFFLIGELVVPVYVVWSRGWIGLAKLLLHVFLWAVLSICTTIAVYVLF